MGPEWEGGRPGKNRTAPHRSNGRRPFGSVTLRRPASCVWGGEGKGFDAAVPPAAVRLYGSRTRPGAVSPPALVVSRGPGLPLTALTPYLSPVGRQSCPAAQPCPACWPRRYPTSRVEPRWRAGRRTAARRCGCPGAGGRPPSPQWSGPSWVAELRGGRRRRRRWLQGAAVSWEAQDSLRGAVPRAVPRALHRRRSCTTTRTSTAGTSSGRGTAVVF
jgi:hypothetical protein